MVEYNDIRVESRMKQQLRTKIVQQFKALNKHEKQIIEYKLHTQLFQQPFWLQSNIIGVTHSTMLEWDTKAIIQRAWDEGKRVALPKSNPTNKTLHFLEINNFTDLEPGYGNILEPRETSFKKQMNDCIELLIVPGLMFDSSGYRLGFGGGFYDRYLNEPHHRSLNISLASQFQLVEKLPVEIYDRPVNYIITEKTCIKIKK